MVGTQCHEIVSDGCLLWKSLRIFEIFVSKELDFSKELIVYVFVIQHWYFHKNKISNGYKILM